MRTWPSMIPISSAKLNNKLANHTRKRLSFNEGRFNKRNCVCLSIGLVLGLCLAGIFFYSSLPNEEYRSNSKNLMKIIGLEAFKNNTQNGTLTYINQAKKEAQLSFPNATLSVNRGQVILEELNEHSDS